MDSTAQPTAEPAYNMDNKDKTSAMVSLGDRMKDYEELQEKNILPYLPFIARLDGKNFSKFTRGLKKPFDNRFVTAMIRTTNDLMDHFNARTGYCHSDEITLIFAPACTKDDYIIGKNESTHVFNGRMQKLTGLLAGYCSVRFNHHFEKLININEKIYKPEVVSKVRDHQAYFDARLIIFPEDKPQEILNHMIWRSVYDCYRNAVATYAQNNFSHKQLEGKDTNDMINMLATVEIKWDSDVPQFVKHGVYCKKEIYEKVTETPTGPVNVLRKRIVNRCFKISFNDEILKMLLDKCWDVTKTDLVMGEVTTSEDGTVKQFMK